MTEPSFSKTYSQAAYLYAESSFSIDPVEEKFGHRNDWSTIREWLVGSTPPSPFCVPGRSNEWFTPSADHEYWPAHMDLLIRKKDWDEESIKSVDIASNNVLNRIFDPNLKGRRRVQGLVIGHVQSGKTANYSAVIAKSADAGYNLFIVLTGLYNDLREQTQSRISTEVTGTRFDSNGLSVDAGSFSKPWKEETSSGYDFHDIDHISHPNGINPTISIIKKNVNPLEKILEWSRSFPQELLSELNVLIIDDEADHASVNTMTGEEISDYSGEPERSPSRINELLRRLINTFPRVSYVGYTATPFANVFINPDEIDDELGETLYPKDFIVSLRKPDYHFGLEDVFQGTEGIYQGSNVVIVPQEEADQLREMTEQERPTMEAPESLKEAIRDYLITGAIRRVRGYESDHHTMMIHTKHTIESMAPLKKRVNAIIDDYSANLLSTTSARGIDLLDEIKSRWEEEFLSNGCNEPWERVRTELLTWFSKQGPSVLEINMKSEDDMDFDSYRRTGLKAIAIGGNRLSRGMTLEGLCVSLFVRPTATHDTLMQMSRWFGFRRSYSDLVRVYVTPEINDRFTGMVEVERALRDDLERYEEQDELKPIDFGVRVLQQHGMHPTRPGARRDLSTASAGRHEGEKIHFTESFHFGDPIALRANLAGFADFVSKLNQPERIGNKEKNVIWRDVPPSKITNLMQALSFPKQNQWPVENMVTHIKNRLESSENELRKWNVVLVGLEDGDRATPLSDYGVGLEIIPPQRTRKAHSNGLGWNSASTDTALDLDYPASAFNGSNGKFSYNEMWKRRDPSCPLLLAYIFDKESSTGHRRGREATSSRTDLFRDGEEKVDILSLVAILPRAVLTDEERVEIRDYWIRPNSDPFPGL